MKTFVYFAILAVATCNGMSSTASGADVEKLELKCNDTEGAQDQVFVKFYVDGNMVKFDEDSDEAGTHRNHIRRMGKNAALIFGKRTREKLSFSKELRIVVMERDTVADDTLADIKISPSEDKKENSTGTQDKVYKFDYDLIWKTGP